MALDTNLVTYFKFDASDATDALGTNNGTASNVTYGTGKINNGANFNGTSSQITLGHTGFISGNQSLTLAAWVKPTNFTARGLLFDCGQALSNRAVYWAIDYTGTILWGKYGGDENYSSTSLTSGAWNFVCLVYDSTTRTATFYLNGSSDGTHTFGVNPNITYGGTVIGVLQDGVNWKLNGVLDEWAYWSRTLSGTEISELYNGGSGFQYPFVAAAGLSTRKALLGVGK